MLNFFFSRPSPLRAADDGLGGGVPRDILKLLQSDPNLVRRVADHLRDVEHADTGAAAPSADENPFDLTDLSDLSERLRRQMRRPSGKAGLFQDRVVAMLHQAKRPLSIVEFMAGFARLHHEEFDRQDMSARLYRLVTKGVLFIPKTSTGQKERGVYGLAAWRGDGVDLRK